MKKRQVPASLFVMATCAAIALANNEDAKRAPSPIVVNDTTELATIDPATLKVTYRKGADPKRVVDQLVKMLANEANAYQQCVASKEEKK